MRSKLAVGGLTVAVAFLLATNPVVVNAAGQITSGQIKNNTIKGKDVKDHSLSGKEIKANTVTGSEVNESSLANVPSASNATTLNALPASSYLTRTYSFTVPTTAASTSKTFTATGVPAGTYLVNYNLITLTAAPRCFIYPTNPATPPALAVADGYGVGGAFFATSSAVITVAAGQTPILYCSGASFTTYSVAGDAVSTLSFTKLDVVTAATAAASKGGPESKPGGVS